MILDTHAWVWLVDDPNRLSDVARDAIERAEDLAISAASAWEVGTLACKGKITFDRPVGSWIRWASASGSLRVIPIDLAIATQAALLARDAFPLDPADRLIYSTASTCGATLVTKDRRIREYDPRGTLW